MPGKSESGERQTARGVLWLTAAKFYFMFTGIALILALPAFFKKFYPDGHVELYGDFRTVMGLVNWLNMVLIGGTIQTVSKFVSEAPGRTGSVKLTTLKVQLLVGGFCMAFLFFGSSFLAESFYKDATLAGYLRLASPIVLIYGFYAVIIGCMNGLGRFKHQAMMDMLFATLKVIMTVAFIAVGLAIWGAIGAFLATSLILLVVSWLLLGKNERAEEVSFLRILGFEWKTLLFAFLLNGLMQVDLQLLKALAPESLGDSSAQAGIYGAALQIGQLPYVATLSVAFVIFPLISKSTFDEDRDRTRRYISTTVKYSLMILAALAACLAASARGIIDLVYPDEYLSGSPALAVLAAGYAFMALSVICANILTASGRPLLSVAIFGLALLASTGLNSVLVPRLGLVGAAWSSFGAMLLAASFAAGSILRFFGVFCPVPALLRIAAACVAVYLSCLLWPEYSALMVLPRGLFQFILFFAVIFATGERAPEIRRLIRR